MVIGAGRVGTAVAVLLARAGHSIVAATGRAQTRERVRHHLPLTRFVSSTEAADACREAGGVLITVPDDRIAMVCAELAVDGAFHRDQHVLHLSGSVGLGALAPAEQGGAAVASVHPLQSFPDVEAGIARLPGSGIAVTAAAPGPFAFAEALATDVGGLPFSLSDQAKPLYHAAAVFASNYLVAVEAVAAELFAAAGVSEPLPLFEPLARATLDATFRAGPARVLTGPAARGDVGTIARNLEALRDQVPDAVAPYVELARVAAGVAARAGRLDAEGLRRVREELDRWT